MNGNTKWILSLIALFIFIATGLGGYAVARIDVVETKLTSDYVQKKDYRADYDRINAGITRLNDKMDEMLKELK